MLRKHCRLARQPRQLALWRHGVRNGRRPPLGVVIASPRGLTFSLNPQLWKRNYEYNLDSHRKR